MEEEYFALYREGHDQPLGAIRKSVIDPDLLIEDLKNQTGQTYRVQPITPEQAKDITDRITNPSGESFEEFRERILKK